MVGSGRLTEMILIAGDEGLMNDALISQIADIIEENDIDLLVIDPLASVMTASESVDNFRQLARVCQH